MLNPHANTSSTSSATRGRFDAMVRFTHLAIAVCFFVVYFTGDNEALHVVHTTCGYSILVLIVFRLMWQMISAPTNQASHLSKRLHQALHFGRSTKNSTSSNQRWRNLLLTVLYLSIVILILILPVTVGLGYLTDNQSLTFKPWHELLAKTALGSVIAHITAIVALSMLMKRFFAKPMLNLSGFLTAGRATTMIAISIIAVLALMLYRFY